MALAVDTEKFCDFLWLFVTTIIFVGVCVVNGLASSSYSPLFGFINATEDISDSHFTEMTPAGYAFLFWGMVYACQVLWIAYAWSFLCRPHSQHTIFTGVYVGYSIVNSLNITWIYLWGNNLIIVSCVTQLLLNIFFYFAIGLQFGYFNHIKDMASQTDRWLTRILVQNGMCSYCTWTTLLFTSNLAAAIPHNSFLNDEDCSTLCLSLVLALLLTYFFLENTVLDRYGFRFVQFVYPIVIWFLVALLVEQWEQGQVKRNNIFAAALLGLSVVIWFVRIVLVILFFRYRKLK